MSRFLVSDFWIPYQDFFLAGITQRPVLQEKGPPQGRGSYKDFYFFHGDSKKNNWYLIQKKFEGFQTKAKP